MERDKSARRNADGFFSSRPKPLLDHAALLHSRSRYKTERLSGQTLREKTDYKQSNCSSLWAYPSNPRRCSKLVTQGSQGRIVTNQRLVERVRWFRSIKFSFIAKRTETKEMDKQFPLFVSSRLGSLPISTLMSRVPLS